MNWKDLLKFPTKRMFGYVGLIKFHSDEVGI